MERTSDSRARYAMLTGATGPVTLRKTGLIIPARLSLVLWQRVGRELAALSESTTWWLADWVLYGETAYTGRYREVIEDTGLGYQTLRNYAWVARRFEYSRRRENLSFAHHAEVASLEQPEQDYWLRRAEQHEWSRNRLRKEVRSSLAEREGQAAARDTRRTSEERRAAGKEEWAKGENSMARMRPSTSASLRSS
ncbi:LmbU family transcriptional regulator [Streptomyces tuirus]|uniref:LmbU family transcriptional regulator n=1 Tax=Streptomyces tuirus TaxID=68278 RepID=A0A941FBJ2_9ACTN|nr:LmbU family transcriptional regulator [Streptomyces tuirus]